MEKITGVFNIFSAILVIIALFNVLIFAFSSKTVKRDINVAQISNSNSSGTAYPDIYYIIPDGYTSFYNLKKYFNFDNEDFLKYLEAKGFYIARKSATNYFQTYTSLASSMNLEHVNYLKEKLGENSTDLLFTYKMVRDNYVFRFLKSKGYRTIHIGCGKGESMHNEYADLDYRFASMSEFMMFLLQTTMLRPFENWFIDDIKRIHMQFKKADEIITMNDKPKIVFLHFLLPHPPLVLDRNGNRVNPNADGNDWVPRNMYVEHVLYTNKLLTRLIDNIIKKSNPRMKPIIILQGDHGPYICTREGGFEKFWLERFGILNAFNANDNFKKKLYHRFTPVNTFRLLFNEYFGTNYDLLPDTLYYSNYDFPYKFIDKTKFVRDNQN